MSPASIRKQYKAAMPIASNCSIDPPRADDENPDREEKKKMPALVVGDRRIVARDRHAMSADAGYARAAAGEAPA